MSRTPQKNPKNRSKSRSSKNSPRKSQQEEKKDDDDDDDDALLSLIEWSHSSVQSASAKAIYAECLWSREAILKTVALTKAKINALYPHGLSQHGEMTLVGKTRYRFRNFVSDKIGLAKKSTLQLEIEHLGRLVRLDSFVVLGFDAVGCFEWSKSPRWPLRLGYDFQIQEILYVAKKAEIVRSSHVESLITVTNTTLKDDLEILCLKSSPKSLKSLIRDYIRRSHLDEDNLNIDKFDFLIESTLLNYVKYSSRLKLGSELHRGESLISPNRAYRLSLDHQGRLVLYLDATRYKYLFLFDNVDSLWFYDLAVLVCMQPAATSYADRLSASKLFPDMASASLICEHLSRLAAYKYATRLKLTDSGFIEIGASSYEYKLVIQFRDDIRSMWNSVETKYECMCYLTKSKNSQDEDLESSDENEDTSSSDDDSNADQRTDSD